MTTRALISSTLLCFAFALSTTLFLGGCVTRAYDKAANTSDALTDAANEVDLARQRIAEATDALGAMVAQPTGDLRPKFERYRRAVEALEKTVGRLENETDKMQREGRAYFVTWDTQLSLTSNEDIRARSAARQQEVTDHFARIQQRYLTARQEFFPLMSDLRDIQAALSVDLRPEGIESAKEFIRASEASATAARQSLDNLANELRALSTTLSPARSE